jgi:hypothetical protein
MDIDKLLYIRHPLDEQHNNQIETLTNFPYGMRENMAQTFRFGNASYRYYQELQSDPTEEDYEEWLTGLPDNVRFGEMERGYQGCKGSLSLRRYSLEKRDLGMLKYLKGVLTKEDWEAHQKIAQKSE